MSIKLLNAVWKTELELTPSEKFVLSFLAYCANDKNDLLCCPSINTISKQCNLSRSHIKRILHSLVNLNIISKINIRTESNSNTSNHYSINVNILEENT